MILDRRSFFIFAFGFLILSCSTKINSHKASFYIPRNWQTPILNTAEKTKTQSKSSTGVSRLAKSLSTQKEAINPSPLIKMPSVYTDLNGVASWYGPGFNGKRTANGEIYNQNHFTAAHRFLPMNTRIKVTNVLNGKTIVVRINDRGPYKKGRVLDVSKKVAYELGFLKAGTTPVKLDVVQYPKNYDPKLGLAPYKKVVVQLAVFTKKERAIHYKKYIGGRYHKLMFMVDEPESGSFHVVAGPYSQRSRAKSVSSSLSSDGIQNIVRSLRK